MTRVGFLSLHSHGDRSFLDDSALALAAGRARRRGDDAQLVLVALDGRAPDVAATAGFAALVAALRGFDVIVYERVWTRAIPAALVAALPDAVVVHWRGEHALDDPPGGYQVETRALPDLLDHLAGRRPSLPVGAHARTDVGWRPGLGALAAPVDRAYVPDLAPIVVNSDGLPAERVLSIDGNAGCPYQADARANPRYAGVAIPDGIGRGCAFCTTGNHYEARPQAETIAAVLEQLTYARREAPTLTRLVLRDQNPFGYLAELLEQCAATGVGGFTLLLQTRADWLLAGERRLQRALDAAARAGITITPFLVGIESFSQDELDRLNKGVTVAQNLALLAALRRWDAHPAFDLAHASFGFILFTPWTTLADLRAAYDGIVATELDRLRGRLLTARVRLYPDTALYYLAAHDGLLADDGASLQPERFGYFPDRAWRFRDPVVARFAALAAAASDASHGRDERQVFRALLELFAESDGSSATVADVLARAKPPAPTRATPAPPPGRSQRTVEVELGRGCVPGCALCAPAPATSELDRALAGGAARVVVRGGGGELATLAPVIARARAAGAAEVVVAGHVDALTDPSAARAWAAAGIDAVLVPVVSHAPLVHDRAVRRDGALVATLVAVRALAAAGVAIELDVPIVGARLQDLGAVLELFARAVPSLAAVRLRLPRHAVPRALAPPPLDELAPRLEAALAVAERLGVRAPLDVIAALPLCAVVPSPRAQAAVRFDPRRPTHVSGCTQPAACAGCAVASACPGVPAPYLAAHGVRGVRPLEIRPAALFAQRTTPLRVWDDRARDAARQAGILVLRPTVHCNQDCGFCSANESTPNVWADPAQMMRAIARAARRGVNRVSFSGGEPTLARELPSYIRVARRAGVPKVELVTNGVLLDRAPRVQALVDAGLTHAFVSLHGHDEASASLATRKRGDFARTVAAIGHLADAGVITVINHVIHAGNAHLLTRFVEEVHARFAGRVMISFAFVTPQYKALEHQEMVPRLTAVAPSLQAAAWRALALGQPFVVGSRQGVPPCFLGPFAAWSDLLTLVHEAASEDAPQKIRAPACDACKFGPYCTGVWKPYAARHGTDELTPVPGAPLGADQRTALLAHARRPPWGQPMAFADVHPLLRDPAAEAAGPPVAAISALPTVSISALGLIASSALGPIAAGSDRPLRALIVGTGRRARALARAAHASGHWAVTAICSPHADLAPRADFAGAPAYTDLARALDDTRPDAVIVASATASHVDAVDAALAARIPVLVEKPVAGTLAETDALLARAAAAGVLLMPAHNDHFAPGLAMALDAARGRTLTVQRLSDRRGPSALQAWHRAPVFEGLYHLAIIAHAHRCDRVLDAAWSGDDRPAWLRVRCAGPDGTLAQLGWTLTAAVDALIVAADRVHWRRDSRVPTLTIDSTPIEVPPEGGELARMLTAFATALRTSAPPPIPAADAATVMRLTIAAVDALAAAGAPLARASAPRHAASPELAPRYR